ncbi:acetoin reductase family protein [Ephemerocybe angulata]|uniref:Acetoin reductase family protein n=1 Tax=Ephemerocybe angulata TaxID=980116 RepID=A0A8H6HXE7_9AGAR|nr:acetoin reductase family protein [Tulosesus angulatus]
MSPKPTASEKGVAIVTGAAQGIGKAVALRLARDGYDISLNDIPSQLDLLKQAKIEVEGIGRRALMVTGDVSVEKDVERLVEDTFKEMGSVDVFVANAGVCLAKSFLETSTEELDRLLSINVRGTFLCYKYAGKQMIQQGRGGRIVGATSGCGFSGVPYLAAYGATKWAIRGLTATAALEFGPHGITVNAYAPSAVPTGLTEKLAASFGMEHKAFFEQEKSSIAVPQPGSAEDVAALVSYFVSKEAHFTTGQSILMDGGR